MFKILLKFHHSAIIMLIIIVVAINIILMRISRTNSFLHLHNIQTSASSIKIISFFQQERASTYSSQRRHRNQRRRFDSTDVSGPLNSGSGLQSRGSEHRYPLFDPIRQNSPSSAKFYQRSCLSSQDNATFQGQLGAEC